jgi:hypothetical protein
VSQEGEAVNLKNYENEYFPCYENKSKNFAGAVDRLYDQLVFCHDHPGGF